VKTKTPWTYVWVGHNRPAFGLSSYFDSHGLILRTLAIQGFGYDRDWGGGLYRDFSWGDISASLTTGSGMPVYFKGGNYMTAARVSYGVQSQDNFNLGFSLGYGNTLDTMGYNLRDPEPREMRLAGVDLTILKDNLEHRFDLYAGRWLDQDTYSLFYRFGVNLDQEGRLKIEAQPTYWKFGEENDYQLSLCFSSQVTSNLTVRLGYTYDHSADDSIVILQLYYYAPI
jgi:opacity protein-like surface antigen